MPLLVLAFILLSPMASYAQSNISSLGLTQGTADKHIKNGNKLAIEGKWAQAEVEFRRAVTIEPNVAKWHANLAMALRMQKKWVAAESEFRRAVELEPRTAQWRNLLGVFLFAQKRLAEAEKELDEAINLEPKNSLLYTNLGLVLEAEEKLIEAESKFREAIRLDPQDEDKKKDLSRLLKKKAVGNQQSTNVDPRLLITKVRVFPHRPWVNTGVAVKQGDIIRITAGGEIAGRYIAAIEGIVWSDPDGIGYEGQKDFRDLALVAVIGTDPKKGILVGKSAEFIADRDGILTLYINRPTDYILHKGYYEAVVEVKRNK